MNNWKEKAEIEEKQIQKLKIEYQNQIPKQQKPRLKL